MSDAVNEIETWTPPEWMPLGHYSPVVSSGGTHWLSGQIGLDPETGTIPDGFAAQLRQTLRNIGRLLEGVGSGFDRVTKITVYLLDAADFVELNAIFAERFPEAPPARTTVVVAALPRPEAQVELDVVAVR